MGRSLFVWPWASKSKVISHSIQHTLAKWTSSMLESSFNREARSLHSTAILCPYSSGTASVDGASFSLFWNISLRNSSCSGRIRFATRVELLLQASHESLSRLNRLLLSTTPHAGSRVSKARSRGTGGHRVPRSTVSTGRDRRHPICRLHPTCRRHLGW